MIAHDDIFEYMIITSLQRRPELASDCSDSLSWITQIYNESLIGAEHTGTRILESRYSCLPSVGWYQDYLAYRKHLGPDSSNNQTSVSWASDTHTADSVISCQSDGDTLQFNSESSKFIWTADEISDLCHDMASVGPRFGSFEFVVDGFMPLDHGLMHGRSIQWLDEIESLIEEGSKERKLQQAQACVVEECTQNPTSKEPAGVIAKDTQIKGRRRGLPLLLEARGGVQEVMTCYDTGTHDNHMSYTKATELGYTVIHDPDIETRFQLPNGTTITAVGHVNVAVQFARHVGPEPTSMTCRFNVFKNLALPMLIGMTFLQATQTLTKYTSRMVDLPMTWKRSLRLCALGSATNQVSCIVDGRRVSAAADTGSEIALISSKYARKRRVYIKHSCEELELADGSLVYTSGFADLMIHVLDLNGWGKGTKTKVVRFHILENLQFDVLLDEGVIDELNIFQDGLATIMSAASGIMPSLAPIVHLRSLEASLAKASDRSIEEAKELYASFFSKPISIFAKANSVVRGKSKPLLFLLPPPLTSHSELNGTKRCYVADSSQRDPCSDQSARSSREPPARPDREKRCICCG